MFSTNVFPEKNGPSVQHRQIGAQPFFQPKLTVTPPGDAHEEEADRVADQVMRMKEGDTPIVQRMPLTPAGGLMRKCAECEQEEKEQVQRKETGGSGAGGKAAPSIVSSVLSSSGGRSMDTGTRQFMESRFGQDFGQVRIHTDARAAESANAIQARAYTSGKDIVFGAGEYQPESESGKRLLAHELTHVGQQGKNSNTRVSRKVADKNVTCANYPKDYPIFKAIKTKDPLGEIQKADQRAIDLLSSTIDELQSGIDYVKGGNPPSWPGISDCVAMALKYQMLINPDDPKSWTGNGPGTVAHVIYRFSKLKKVFEGGFVTYTCISPKCGDEVAFVWAAQTNYHLKLCLKFWSMGLDDRALTFIHEISHVYFKTEDHGFKGPGAAHCLEQFIASINGIPVPKEFQSACNYLSLGACH